MSANRRSVLGAMSASQANVRGRASLGIDRGAQKKEARRSVAPASRRSIMGPPSSLGLIDGPSLGASSRKSLGGSGTGMASLGRASMGVGRQSIGAGRQSMGGRSSIGGRSSMGGRSSLGGSKSSRRSSIHANATGTSDPRPMSDKTYKAQCIRNLIEFLTQNGYNGTQLSPKILSAPSNKDFIRIFQFVYSFVDPNYNWGDSKPEDEIPQLFKMVGYPFTVNKSAIFSSGSPHNWPKLLGALTWLVELATYQQAANIEARIFQLGADEEFEQETAGENEVFFDYLEKAYMAFLAGDDDFQALEDDLAQGFHARNEEIAAATEQLREEEAAQEAELATFGAAPSPLEQLEKSKADFTLDVQKFNTLIANLTAHHKKVQARLQKLQAEDRSRDEELESLAGNIARLQAVKDQQEMTPADVDRINSARTQLDHQSAQITARKEEMDQKAWKQEMQVAKLLEEVEAIAGEFNKKAESLNLIPSTARNANGVEYEVKINGRASNPKDMLSALSSLRDQINAIAHAHKSELLGTGEMVKKMEEMTAAKQDDVSLLQARLAAAEEQYQRDEEAMRAEYKRQVTGVESLQQDVARMRLTACSAHLASEEALEKLRLEYGQLRSRAAAETEAANKAILRALHIVTAHKDRVVTQLASLKAYALSIRNS